MTKGAQSRLLCNNEPSLQLIRLLSWWLPYHHHSMNARTVLQLSLCPLLMPLMLLVLLSPGLLQQLPPLLQPLLLTPLLIALMQQRVHLVLLLRMLLL